jgi:hypothetical protein
VRLCFWRDGSLGEVAVGGALEYCFVNVATEERGRINEGLAGTVLRTFALRRRCSETMLVLIFGITERRKCAQHG